MAKKISDCYRDTGSNVEENKNSAGSLYSCSSICGSSEYNYLGLKVHMLVEIVNTLQQPRSYRHFIGIERLEVKRVFI